MTRPDEMLAVHEGPGLQRNAWVELEDGRILMNARGQFQTSDDKGLTWSEAWKPADEDGGEVACCDLVRLSGGAIGLAAVQRGSRRSDFSMVFRRSDDGGKTWSRPVRMNSVWPAAAFQDTMLRTTGGRLVLPVYAGFGQGGWRAEDAPYPGGYMNGQFVGTDAHFVDAHFTFCYALYSDDDGATWDTSEGELIIKSTHDGAYEYANEPSVAEVSPGTLIMVARNRLGRLFQAFSHDDGAAWGRLQPTMLASSTAPAQIRRIPANGHLLCVWNQENEDDVRKGLVRLRISSAISRNGGGMWEFFQNVESILPGSRVEPGPIRPTLPEGMFDAPGKPAPERDGQYTPDLPSDMGRWSYPSVLALDDRVLISHTYSRYDKPREVPAGTGRIKVLPLSWFYGGADPLSEEMKTNRFLKKVWGAAQP